MLEETIKKIGNKYIVYPKKGGKRLGTHDTLSAAKKQLRAIEMSKHMGEDKVPGGLADKMSLSDIAKKHGVSNQQIKDQLKMGIKVELEHTDDKSLAAEIAMDHLVEDPEYYTKLKKMEEHSCVFCGNVVETEINEDLRKWFGSGSWGGKGGGGWDRYNSKGKRIGKCGAGKEGEGYAACLSKAAAKKLGKKGIASFVRRKKDAQQKAGRGKKGSGAKGKAPVRVSWDKKGQDKKYNPPN